MGGGASELTGPDLTNGVLYADLEEHKPLLGHANGEAVVVVRVGSTVHAVGATCTHYSGPLAEGRIVGETIRCPWHHACFDLRTGQAIGAPALTDVPCWEVERSGDLVQVRTKKSRPKRRPARSPSSIVLVGAGAASAACAEMLRAQGYTGPITMLGGEEPGPVDRPNLSKDYLAGSAPEEWIPLGSTERWKELGVELVIDPVTTLDVDSRTVTTASGKTRRYGALLYATGAEPLRLPIEGASLPHVFTLRSLADARAIIGRVTGGAKRAVILGASFIGLEVAASLVARGIEVHVVGREATPLAHVLGEEVGRFVQKVHEGKGTRFHLGTTPARILEESVVLANGESLDTDLVVMGVGVKPRSDLAAAAGLRVAPGGGVLVDASLRTNATDVWAAGDVARYDGRSRIEHWVTGERAGQHAAREMLRDPDANAEPFRSVPFFWSAHHDVTISYVGHLDGPIESVEVEGSLDARDATITYRSGASRAIATIQRDPVSLAAEEALEREAAVR